MNRHTKIDHSTAETFIWVTAFIVANLRGTIIWDVLKQGFGLTSIPWVETAVWAVLFLAALQILLRMGLMTDYVRLWKQNWLVIVFILIAFLSLLWSVFFSASLYRAAALLFSSLIGAYIGTRYSLQELLETLFQFGTLLLIICFVLALFLPVAGRMDWEPYNGAWRGLFWHKNQFGSLAALFTLVFLVRTLAGLGKKDGEVSLSFVFYLFSCVLVYLSESVAGYFLVLIMSIATLLAFIWLKTRHRLRALHYYGFLGIAAIMAMLLFLNLDLVFGLFNRNTSLTGRLPLWDYLITDIFAQSPWLGHGFGALWSDGAFRIATSDAVNWNLPVAIGDNGFLDILLHVGLVGFIPFVGVLLTLARHAIKFIGENPSIEGFFPLLLLIYAIIANISFSLFLETETFVWLVMIAALFIVTKDMGRTKKAL